MIDAGKNVHNHINSVVIGTALMFIAVLSALSAQAQRVAVVTTTMSALREATGVYLHVVDMERGTILPGVVKLTGNDVQGSLQTDLSGTRLLLGTNSAWGTPQLSSTPGRSWNTLVNTIPLFIPPAWRSVEVPGWQVWPLGFTSETAILARTSPDGLGSLQLSPLPDSTEEIWASQHSMTLELPGTPVSGTVWENEYTAILCSGPKHDYIVLYEFEEILDPKTIQIERPHSASDLVPAALAVSHDGSLLWVLVHGFSLDAPQGGAVSWVYTFLTSDLSLVSPPQQIRGVPWNAEEALHPASKTDCWVTLRTPGTDFARAVLLRAQLEGSETSRAQEIPLTGIVESFVLAPTNNNSDVAVAMDKRLELWPEGSRGDGALEFEAPIRQLCWSEEGLLVGEAGRIHLIETTPSLNILESVQLQSGWVRDLYVYDRGLYPINDTDCDGISNESETLLGTDTLNPDSDGDGLPDAVDPVPGTPTAWMATPEEIRFEGEAAGRELRAMRIDPHQSNATWRITYDRDTTPWLVINPTSGIGVGHIYMGVDPDYYVPGSSPVGQLHVLLNEEPAAIADLRILPGRLSARNILWACGDNKEYERLRQHLSTPPRLFAHHRAGVAHTGDLGQYAIVVLDVSAAASGVLTRSEVMDYVRRGGALLYIGHFTPERPTRNAGRFLGPVGIYFDTMTKEAGLFEGTENNLGKYWKRFAIDAGARLYAEAPYRVVPDGRGGNGAVLAARTYGHGRIAVLAGPAPLGDKGLHASENKRFASRLFTWLNAAKAEFQDFDGDGLPDEIEDSLSIEAGGAHNTIDPGETDYLYADTDHDGIPDGIEDSNLNGRVDDGETDPRSLDSDGDGIYDGADATPTPAAGAPRITYLDPEKGPADGGIWVTLGGTNLVPGSNYWFGENRVQYTRGFSTDLVELRLPDAGSIENGAVPVRVVHPDGKLETALPNGFTYTKRREAIFSLSNVTTPVLRNQLYEGEVGITINAPEDVSLQSIQFQIVFRGRNSADWPELTGVSRTSPAGGEVSVRHIRNASYEVIGHASNQRNWGNQVTIVLPYKSQHPNMRFVLTFEKAHVSTTTGSMLAINLGQYLDIDAH